MSSNILSQCLKLRQFAMPETCENWLGLVHSWVYYARQTPKIDQVLPYSVDFRAPDELWNPLSKCSVIWNKRPRKVSNDRKVQNNFGPANIFLFFNSIRHRKVSNDRKVQNNFYFGPANIFLFFILLSIPQWVKAPEISLAWWYCVFFILNPTWHIHITCHNLMCFAWLFEKWFQE